MLVKYRGQSREIDAATQRELCERIAEAFSLDSFKVLGGGTTITPESAGAAELAYKPGTQLMVLAAPSKAQIEQMHAAEAANAREAQRRDHAYATLAQRARRPASQPVGAVEYTFSRVEALDYGDRAGAQRFLERIRDDKAVQRLMAKHRLKVGLLTELDPATNTGASERRLGLNENAGAVIRLRIRTDAYDGFCNYREIMEVLCHELAHNTHGDHSKEFWATCRQYEKELKQLDPWKNGRSLQ